MYRWLWKRVPVVILLFVLIACSASGQLGSSSISGTVHDSAGAALVSANVVLEPTGRQVATDQQGGFRFTDIAPGHYTVKATYVGFQPYTGTVDLTAGQPQTVDAMLKVGSQAETVLVTAGQLQGDAEAVNVERMSSQIVQVEPQGVIRSLPNNNIADAVGRLPSVSLERDEGEGKYIQIRGTEPRLTNVTVDGVELASPEVVVRNIKLDAVPANIVERIEVYKTLGADQDADAIGGTVNLVTELARSKPTYYVSGTTGYNPIQNGYWRGGFDATFGQRFLHDKLGILVASTWDRTNRGIDDLEPSQTATTLANGKELAYVSSEDLRSYKYYRTRYGFDLGLDYKFTPTMTVYVKGLFADFHDYGEATVYSPNAGTPVSGGASAVAFDNTGNYQYRQYIRRPDQQVFGFLTGGKDDLNSNVINYEFAVSRGHNIGGQAFPTTYFNGPSNVTFKLDNSDPYRPKLLPADGTNGYDAKQYGVSESDYYIYHATQLNIEGAASLDHNYSAAGHPSIFSLGIRIRNSRSNQFEDDRNYLVNGTSPFPLSDVQGSNTNPTYYDKSFAINGQAYGPMTDYSKILRAVNTNATSFALDTVGSSSNSASAFFNANERVSAGYVQDVIFFGKFRLQGGVRFDNDATTSLANNVVATYDSSGNPLLPAITPNQQSASYFNVLPSASLEYHLRPNTNLRAVYSRGLARPNIGDVVPATVIDPNQTPYPTIATGNPTLRPTKGNDYDLLVVHYFQRFGILQAGYYYKQLTDPIYPVASLLPNYNNTGKTYQQTESINGPQAYVQGIEVQYEQRFSFLPGVLNGIGASANYSHNASRVSFPANFDGGRTDHPDLDRSAPNNYNFGFSYDKSRFSSRFAISHNDASIAAYQWSAGNGAASDPIYGLRGPTGDNYFYPHTQFDVQGSYRVYKGLQFVASGMNLSNEVFGFYNGSAIYPVQREYYHPTTSFGFRWSLDSE